MLRAAVRQFARSLLLSCRAGVPVAPSWSLAIDGRRLTLVGTIVETGAAPAVVVRVEGAAPAYPDARALRSRFGLTAQEARTALLRAEGASTATVAEQLGVSMHTARRHTERVLAKLGVHRVAAIAPQILGTGGPPPLPA